MTKKVLIVDDEKNIITSLEFLMTKAGYQVQVAHNGEDGLQKIAQFQPDLILLDAMMPKLNGFDVCRQVRQNSNWQHIKIIMLTARGREVDINKGLSLGADTYVTKPFSTRELMDKVSQLLQ